jgi:HD-like signal output (HDOD) protein
MQDQYTFVLHLMDEGRSFHEAERELGLSHTAIGYMLAERWDLPEVHSAAIRYHHTPEEDTKFFGSTALIYLADRMARSLKIGQVQESNDREPPRLLKRLGLNDDAVRNVARNSQEELPRPDRELAPLERARRLS